jgi:hypothetical protein
MQEFIPDPKQQKRTDDLTYLADKYNMTVKDRTKLYKIYLEAAQLPKGWVAMPEEPCTLQLHAGLINERQPHTASVWIMMKEHLAAQYRKMVKARPSLPTKDKDDDWGSNGSVF